MRMCRRRAAWRCATRADAACSSAVLTTLVAHTSYRSIRIGARASSLGYPSRLRNFVPSRRLSVMEQNPTCPNCGRPMTVRDTGRPPLPDDGPHIFECRRCSVVFMTEDHIPVSGVPVQ
jgi:hypothetical protein